jgi:hypothetical protein
LLGGDGEAIALIWVCGKPEYFRSNEKFKLTETWCSRGPLRLYI